MFCTKCGAPVTGTFCRNCGTPVGQPGAPVPAPPPPPPAAPSPQPPYGQAAAPPPPPPPGAYGSVPTYVPPYGAAPPPPAMDYAQWGTRALGYIIDSLVVGAICGVLFLLSMLIFGSAMHLGSGLGSDGMQALGSMGCCLMISIFTLGTLLVGLYNKVYLVSKRGASIGQGIAHVRVVDANGNLLSMGTAGLRLLAQIGLGFIPMGSLIDLLWPLWDERRQTLHDKAVSCYVINNRA